MLRLAASIRLAGPAGNGLCKLLTVDQRAQAERVASAEHIFCGKAALKIANVSAVQLKAIVLISASPGPKHWAGFISFTNPAQRSHPQVPRYGLSGVNMEIIQLPGGTWAVKHLYYEL